MSEVFKDYKHYEHWTGVLTRAAETTMPMKCDETGAHGPKRASPKCLMRELLIQKQDTAAATELTKHIRRELRENKQLSEAADPCQGEKQHWSTLKFLKETTLHNHTHLEQ